MKIRLLSLLLVAFSLTIAFTACKKDSSTTGNGDSSTEIAAQSDDQAQVSAALDALAGDADTAINSSASTSGKVLSICDATAEITTTADTKKITITYAGTNCNGLRSRTGKVTVSMPLNAYWKDAGAVITITAENLKVTRLSDNKSVTINGTETITNVSGGLLKDLATRDEIVHAIASDGISVTFDNNAKRTWKLAIKRTFSYDDGIVVAEEGTHTEGVVGGIAVWGTNRFGNDFSWSIATPLVVRQDCSFRLVSGTAIHTASLGIATTSFGLNASGDAATACPGAGGYYYFKTVFVGVGGKTFTVILPY